MYYRYSTCMYYSYEIIAIVHACTIAVVNAWNQTELDGTRWNQTESNELNGVKQNFIVSC